MEYGNNLKSKPEVRQSYYDKWMKNNKERDVLETIAIMESMFAGKPTTGFNTNLYQNARNHYDQFGKEKNLWKDSNDYLDYIYQMLMEPEVTK